MSYSIKIKKFITYALHIAITIIQGFLFFRLLLKMLAANTSPFVEWIYSVSGDILHPFEGMFAPYVSEGGHVLEFTTIFAIGFYAIIYYFVYQLVITLADVIQKNSPKRPESAAA